MGESVKPGAAKAVVVRMLVVELVKRSIFGGGVWGFEDY